MRNGIDRINSNLREVVLAIQQGMRLFLWMPVPKWFKIRGASVPQDSIRSKPY